MSNPLLTKSTTSSPRIVDLVFVAEPAGQRKRLALGGAVVLAIYGGLFVLVSRMGNSLGPWSAEMAARVHDAIAMERAVEVTPPPPPPPPSPLPSPSESPSVATPRMTRVAHISRSRPVPPAQAGQLAAVSAAPIDFTGSTFIVGSGASYAGGVTSSTGTSRKPVLGAVIPGTPRSPSLAVGNRARQVSLDQAAWNCPWPAEADAQQVNEQTVVLRASIRADGRADSVEILADPGLGFGAAARLCALTTRFEPAHNRAGLPIAAQSPPIRVHFFR
jgi:protein TonB